MRAAGYVRISMDRESEERGISRQREDVRALAEKIGADLIEVFADNDISASTRSKKVRPGYEAMLERVRAGEFDAILSYSNSRLTRRPRELEDLITLHESTGVRIHTTVSGSDDLSNADGRMTARIKASVDAAEAERTGERVARAHLEKRKRGEVMGKRPFGWSDDRITIHATEGPLARKAIEMLVGGANWTEAAGWLNDQGARTATGKLWTGGGLKQWAKNPRLVGLVGSNGVPLLDGDLKPVVGQWEPLIDEDTWSRLEAVKARPFARKGTQSRPGARNFDLSGIAICGVCNGTMHAGRWGGVRNDGVDYGHYYQCRGKPGAKHGNYAAGRSVDRIVKAAMLRILNPSSDEEKARLAAMPEWDGQARLDQLRGLIDELMDALDKGLLSPARIFAKVGEYESEIEQLEAQKQAWISATTGPRPGKQTTPAQWDAMSVSTKQGLILSYFNGFYIRPLRAGLPGRVFDPERVVPIPKEGVPPVAL